MPFTFMIIVVIVAVFCSVLLAKAIYAPFSRRKEDRRYRQWREDNMVNYR